MKPISGIFKHPGVLSLIKKYHFHWFIFTIAVLALLFIWKNSALFCAPAKEKPVTTGRRFHLRSGFQPGFNQPAAPQYSSPTAFADLHPGMGTHDSARKAVSKRATGAIKISLSNDYNPRPQIH